ncbi:glycosyltransferase family 2 protein [Leptolyngbya sp. AN02str]|uniref:glycosyltransferase family 2 protein n=1 Tax=Leptolyngbya sp. AN02str TaxID=3423363 RepID=UPI003D3206BF
MRILDRLQKKFKTFKEISQSHGVAHAFHVTFNFIIRRLKVRKNYQAWITRNSLTKKDILSIQADIQQLSYQPRFSIILPVYNIEPAFLVRAIESVRNQLYKNWELCIVDDGSTLPAIQPVLEKYAQLDPRVKVSFRKERGGISASSNVGLDLATGDYIGLLDHDDELPLNALYENAKLIHQHPDADFIYSDEDKIDESGQRFAPFFKPDWSPDYLQGCMYTCHFGVYRTQLVRAVGGFRSEYDGAQDWDLVLRITEKTNHVYHIPKILYHWRTLASSTASGETAKPWAYNAAKRALEDMVQRSSYPGRVEELPQPGCFRVRRHIVGNPLISIVIPTAGKQMTGSEKKSAFVENCIQSILKKTTYSNYEVVVVDGYDAPDEVVDTMLQSPKVKLVRRAEPFNFSDRINFGVQASSGELILLLNDDTEVITQDWLESLLELAQQQEVGCVGAKLLFPNGNIQHAGVLILEGNPGHAFYNAHESHLGYFGSNVVNRNYLAVTAACLMVRREVFEQVGGFDESFPMNYNDVDFCLKVHQAGYRNVFTPHAQLTHHESVTRKPGLKPGELERIRERWNVYLDSFQGDPYYNANFFQQSPHFIIN